MQPNSGIQGQPVNPIVNELEQATPVQPTSVPMQPAPVQKKKSNAALFAIVLLLIVALGGVGFGVYMMMDKNQEVDRLNKQISDLKTSISNMTPKESSGSDSSDESTDEIKRTNPIISDVVDGWDITTYSNISIGDGKYMELSIKGGAVQYCGIQNSGPSIDCAIGGLDGRVYKADWIGEGQALDDTRNMAFIMEDGTVQYFGLLDAADKTAFDIKGVLNIDGKVVDIIHANATKSGLMGGFGTTLFVLSDGSYVKFDKSMLQ